MFNEYLVFSQDTQRLPFGETLVPNPNLSSPPHDSMTAAVARLDFAVYLAKVGEIANRLSLLRMDRMARPAAAEPPANGDVESLAVRRRRRSERRSARKVRPLSAAGKSRIDLQVKMLGAIPAKARAEFVRELAEHARQFPASAQYLRDLADQGHSAAREVVARIGGER